MLYVYVFTLVETAGLLNATLFNVVDYFTRVVLSAVNFQHIWFGKNQWLRCHRFVKKRILDRNVFLATLFCLQLPTQHAGWASKTKFH